MIGGQTTGQGWARRLWGYMVRRRRDLYLAFLAAILGSACQTAIPLVERQIVDGAVISRTSSLWPWLVGLVALSAAAFGFAYVRRYRGGRVALGVQYDLRNAMHDHIQVLDFQTLDKMPTGQLVARATSDSNLVQGLLNFLPIMSGNVLLLVVSLAMMLYLSPLLAVVSVVTAPSLFAVSYRMRRRVFPATWDAQQKEGEVAQIVDEDVNGVRVVKAFAQERAELRRLERTSAQLYGSQMRAVRIQARFQPLLEAIPSLGQVAVLAAGGWLVLRHEISLGTFLAFSTYIAWMLAPARQLAGVLTVGQQARAGVERIFQLLDTEPTIVDRPGATDLGLVEGAIRFRDVHFSFGDGPEVLSGFDLDVRPGEKVALVGASGSGKSTAALLVGRFHEVSSGSVEVDGHDVRDVTLTSLRRQVGMVFEESFLFSDTVKANIAYGNPGAGDAEIEEAAKAAQADGFVRALPKGYETVVGERGLSLSGGQRQRVALARALLYRPRVLVLDDATSAVDARVEEAIHVALRERTEGLTTLLVAHRRSTLHLADRIAVVEGGRVVEQGAHEELAASSSRYRALLAGLEPDRPAATDGPASPASVSSGWAGAISTPALVAYAASANGHSANGHSANGHSTNGHSTNGHSTNGQGSAPSVSGSSGPPSIGPGLGGGRGGWRLSLAPTEQLLSQVAKLPPVRDFPQVDLEGESRQDPSFNLRRLLGEFRRPLLGGLVLVIVDSLSAVVGPVLVRQGLASGVEKGSAGVLFAISAVYLAVVVLGLADQVAETFITGRTAQRIMLSLRIRIWAQLQRLSLDYYEREMAGRIMTRMTTDVDQFESLVQSGLLSALVAFVTFAGVAVSLVVINARLGLLTLSVVVPLAAATVVFRRRAAVLYELSRERIGAVNADFQESLAGAREAQAFCHQDLSNERFHDLGRAYLDSRVGAQRLVATYFPFVQFLSGAAVAIVLGVGAMFVRQGSLGPAALIAFVLYIDLFFSPVQQLSQVFDSWQQTRVSVGRIAQLMREPVLVPSPQAPVPAGSLSGALALESVHFAYPSSRRSSTVAGSYAPAPSAASGLPATGLSATGLPAAGPPAPPPSVEGRAGVPAEALRGVHLVVRPGQTVALVGETGAGKSTVMKLIARFYDPDDGRVAADGTDLRTMALVDYRRQLGYVPQEAFLFSGSVRHNVAYGRPEASDEEVQRALQAVGAEDLVASLPGGLDHELVERGRSLSAGQRQLLALARAELVQPAVLLLDEATSNLDLATEAKVTTAMKRVSDGRTTVVVAHRLQTAKGADVVVVLDGGQVAESGTHEELLALGGRYASMWATFEMEPAGKS